MKIALLCLCLVGCRKDWSEIDPQVKREMTQAAQGHERLAKADPEPAYPFSYERKNLIRRLNRFNQASFTSYITLVSSGKVIASYTVDGKVSSLSSILSIPEQIVTITPMSGQSSHVVSASSSEGVYGKREEGIFFFTAEGTYVEWRGDYLWTDMPQKLTPEPVSQPAKPVVTAPPATVPPPTPKPVPKPPKRRPW